jgi:hypothetical protein
MKISKPAPAGAVLAGVALVLSLALVPAALAGKGQPSGGGGGGGYSVTVSPAGPYSFGDEIYTTTNAPEVSQSYISLICSQNGAVVLSGSHANWSGGWYYNWPWMLGPTQSWTSGPASCTVTVFQSGGKKTVTEATTSFQVSG